MKGHSLGFPRIGAHRELKKALEAYWKGQLSAEALEATGAVLRAEQRRLTRQAGLDFVTVGDFSLYDHVLDWSVQTGSLPARYRLGSDLDSAFAAARGTLAVPPLPLTKWFDTNYHFLVPELSAETAWDGDWELLLAQVHEALAEGWPAAQIKPVVLSPVTFLYLSRWQGGGDGRLSSLDQVLTVWTSLLKQLVSLGIEWVQVDEPILALDLEPAWLEALQTVWQALSAAGPNLLLTTYFGGVEHHRAVIDALPAAGVHLDLCRGPDQLDSGWLDSWPEGRILSAGVVDGRNVWAVEPAEAARLVAWEAVLGSRLWVGTSCSLLHVPVDANLETDLPETLRQSLAFAVQKLDEVARLSQGQNPSASAQSGKEAGLTPAWPTAAELTRTLPVHVRLELQRQVLGLPDFPVTSIGSFPQTAELRRLRKGYVDGLVTPQAYEAGLEAEIRRVIAVQEELGVDVLVHGEPERTDMSEYFGQQLEGCAVTRFGWVQSYGSRCVKPPLLHAPIRRRQPMTVRWAAFAAGLTHKPVKGMLTGPVTLLQWAFCRPGVSRSSVAFELARALRQEVSDLEAAGLKVIQVDEPAFREGLPLRQKDHAAYWDWAVAAFRLATAGVRPETQIHTHMCYSDFRDCLDRIAALDADVITIETSRSDMALLEVFGQQGYPAEVGPGIWDIHSPRVPAAADMVRQLTKALAVLPRHRLWVNPDCGLKTRGWEETTAGLKNLVEAARQLRAEV